MFFSLRNPLQFLIFAGLLHFAPAVYGQETKTDPLDPKPKIVLFWASVGNGHLSASRSIESEVKRIYPGADIVLKDVREFMWGPSRYIADLGHDWAMRFFPGQYDRWFRNYMRTALTTASMGDMPSANLHNPDKMLAFLEAEKPDLIFSSFMHATESLIQLRDRGFLRGIPVAQVLTDYVNTIYFEKLGNQIEMSFVPHDAIREIWIQHGFPKEKVATTGMPVSPKAYVRLSIAEKEVFLRSRDLDPAIRTVLLVSGSTGIGNFGKIVSSIAEHSRGMPLQVVAITGSNTDNYYALIALRDTLPSNITLRFYRTVPQNDLFRYMKSSDLVITKSGGLSISEVAVINKPMVILDIGGGQESYNAEFFSREKMALSIKDQGQAGIAMNMIFESEALQKEMLLAQARYQTMIDSAQIGEWTQKFCSILMSP